ncbi:MAG: DUF1540 domain-containing protein [Clostridium sp.]
MPSLSCTASSCMHNSSNCCCNSSIQVGGAQADKSKATCCESFAESDGSFTNSAQTPNQSLQISCEAQNCIHNSSCQCAADSVDISGASACTSQETKCSSFSCRG